MTYAIKDCKPGHMCLDEKSGRLFVSSASGMRELRFPECKTVQTFGNIGHAYLTLSPDGKYLAAYNNDHQLRVYETDHLDAPIVSKKWTVGGTDVPCRFLADGTLVVPVQDYLIGITLTDEPCERVLYGDPSKKPHHRDWNANGRVSGFSTRGNEIAAIHRGFQNKSYILYSPDGGAHFEKHEYPVQQGEYSQVWLPPQGGLYLFSATPSLKPVLYFEDVHGDFQSPNREMKLAGGMISLYQFSDDGRHVAMQSAGLLGNRIDLYETQGWKKVGSAKEEAHNSSFSSEGRYWLVPGRKPAVIELDQ